MFLLYTPWPRTTCLKKNTMLGVILLQSEGPGSEYPAKTVLYSTVFLFSRASRCFVCSLMFQGQNLIISVALVLNFYGHEGCFNSSEFWAYFFFSMLFGCQYEALLKAFENEEPLNDSWHWWQEEWNQCENVYLHLSFISDPFQNLFINCSLPSLNLPFTPVRYQPAKIWSWMLSRL